MKKRCVLEGVVNDAVALFMCHLFVVFNQDLIYHRDPDVYFKILEMTDLNLTDVWYLRHL